VGSFLSFGLAAARAALSAYWELGGLVHVYVSPCRFQRCARLRSVSAGAFDNESAIRKGDN
jgi:hypothetical protein